MAKDTNSLLDIPRLKDGANPTEATVPLRVLGDLGYAPRRSLTHYFRLLIKYRLFIAAVSLGVVGVVALYVFTATSLYTATAKLEISTYAPLVPGAGSEDFMRQRTREEDYLNTKIDQLISLSLADKVLAQDGLGESFAAYLSGESPMQKRRGAFPEPSRVYGTAEFEEAFRGDLQEGEASWSERGEGTYYSFSDELLRSYLSTITVLPVRKTTLVNVSATTADPELSAKLANAHGEAFIDLVRSERHRATVENLSFLKRQAAELQQKLKVSEETLAQYAEREAIIAVDKEENIMVRRVAGLTQLLAEATARKIRAESAYLEAKKGSIMDSTIVDDAAINELRIALNDSMSEYYMLQEKFTPDYPAMGQLRARIEALEQELRIERQRSLNTLEMQYLAAKEAERKIKEKVEGETQGAFELAKAKVEYNSMQREFESLREWHRTVLRQLTEAQLSVQRRESNVTIVDYATVPRTPSRPRRRVSVLLALFAGPVLGFILCLLIEDMNKKIETPDDVEEVLGIPYIGMVPSFANDDTLPSTGVQNGRLGLLSLPSNSQNGHKFSARFIPSRNGRPSVSSAILEDGLVTVHAPRSSSAEAFRSIRAALLRSSRDRGPRILMVTSPQDADGKTTVAANLAVAASQVGLSTVLLEADFRRPRLARAFHFNPRTRGLADYLSGDVRLDEILPEPGEHGLSILTAGTTAPHPATLVASKKMTRLIRLLSTQYDYVIVDTPPVIPVADALALAPAVDGTVLVMRSRYAQVTAAQEAVTRLRQVGAPLLGVILNEVSQSGEQRGKYYREQHEENGHYETPLYFDGVEVLNDDPPLRRKSNA